MEFMQILRRAAGTLVLLAVFTVSSPAGAQKEAAVSASAAPEPNGAAPAAGQPA